MSYRKGKLKMGQILTLKLNLTLKVKVNHPQNNRDLNQGLLHLSMWLQHTQTDTQTDKRRQRQYPKAKTGLG